MADTEHHVRFYQVGSFAVGNRLVPLELRSLQSDANRPNALTSGHRGARRALCDRCGRPRQ
jgi:pyruvate ferredoxin oxidoreductase beta subunit